MIIGIGIDLVHIPRMERMLRTWGERFKERVFSGEEIKYSENHLRREQHFAGNFAVKEAFIKALGQGNMRLRDIEIVRNEKGKPAIQLYGRAKAKVEEMDVTGIHTSISHDGEYSIAVVVFEA